MERSRSIWRRRSRSVIAMVSTGALGVGGGPVGHRTFTPSLCGSEAGVKDADAGGAFAVWITSYDRATRNAGAPSAADPAPPHAFDRLTQHLRSSAGPRGATARARSGRARGSPAPAGPDARIEREATLLPRRRPGAATDRRGSKGSAASRSGADARGPHGASGVTGRGRSRGLG